MDVFEKLAKGRFVLNLNRSDWPEETARIIKCHPPLPRLLRSGRSVETKSQQRKEK